MKAMILKKICEIRTDRGSRIDTPLEMVDMPIPVPDSKQVLVKISACGVCHTEIDEIEGRLMPPVYPLVLGHEAVGRIEELGSGTTKFKKGDRIGIAWIYSSCGDRDKTGNSRI